MDFQQIDRKRRSETMAKYIASLPGFKSRNDSTLRKLATNVDRCAGWLMYHEYYTEQETRLVAAETCKKHLLCPFCASGRGSRSIAKNMPKVMDYLAEKPKLIPVLLTLTIKDGHDLDERYRHLKSAYTKIRKRRADCLRRGDVSEFGKIDGAIYSFEQTWSQDTGWHPHIHMMAFLTDYIDKDALSREWLEITGDSFIVDIRQIRPKSAGHGALGIEGALCEVYKYAVKLSDLTPELTWEAYRVLSRKRLTGALGALYGRVIEADDVLDEEIDGKPYVWRFYTWFRKPSTYNLGSFGHIDPGDPPDPRCRASLDGLDPHERRPFERIDPATGEIIPY